MYHVCSLCIPETHLYITAELFGGITLCTLSFVLPHNPSGVNCTNSLIKMSRTELSEFHN